MAPPPFPPDQIILTVDIGSSGVRCMAYRLDDDDDDDDDAAYENNDDGDNGRKSRNVQRDGHCRSRPRVSCLDGCNSVAKMRIVEPGTGRILGLVPTSRPESLSVKPMATSTTNTTATDRRRRRRRQRPKPLLDRVVDGCVSDVLDRLRRRYGMVVHDSSSLVHSTTTTTTTTATATATATTTDTTTAGFVIVAVGFSSFVMNLVGVDENGEVVTSTITSASTINDDGDEDDDDDDDDDDDNGGVAASISYACNAPNVAAECRKIRSDIGQCRLEEMYRRVGAPLHSAYALPQLRSFYSNPPTSLLASNVRRWQTVAGLCIGRWTGRIGSVFLPLSYSEASWTGMLDFRTCQWDDECLSLLPTTCVEALPELSNFANVGPFKKRGEGGEVLMMEQFASKMGEVNPYWNEWPELRRCRFFLGVGDGAVANVGSKCTAGSGRIATTIGTSAASRIVLTLPVVAGDDSGDGNDDDDGDDDDMANHRQSVPPPPPDDETRGKAFPPPGLLCYRIDTKRVLLAGALTDGGSAVEWARSFLRLESDDDKDDDGGFRRCMEGVSERYEQKVANGVAGSAGRRLTAIPFLSGERSTGFRDGATGCILGLTRDSTSEDLLGAVLEGVTLRVCAVLRLLREATGDADAAAAAAVSSSSMVNDATKGEGNVDAEPSLVIVASGTALENNSLWRQMLADASGLTVVLDADSSDSTSRGVALLVADYLTRDGRDGGVATHAPEELIASERSDPRECAKAYWKAEEMAQEDAINAVSRLWS